MTDSKTNIHRTPANICETLTMDKIIETFLVLNYAHVWNILSEGHRYHCLVARCKIAITMLLPTWDIELSRLNHWIINHIFTQICFLLFLCISSGLFFVKKVIEWLIEQRCRIYHCWNVKFWRVWWLGWDENIRLFQKCSWCDLRWKHIS